MKLRDLFSDEIQIDPQAGAIDVTGLAIDSRVVKPGDLFFALAGARTDGARFIDAALAAGAVAVAGDHLPQGLSVPLVTTANPRRALALAAAKFFSRQPATIAAVTGTSGKTSVAAFTRQIWQRLGHASASIGTIGLVSPKRTVYGSLTTPDPIALHRQLDEIARDGVTHLAFEASSHGLDQYRLDGVRIAAGGFTNLSRDHMDYHPDVAHYLNAKLRLFRDLVPPGGAAVISADHDCSAQVIEAARKRGLAAADGRRQRRRARRGHSPRGSRHRRLCAEARARTSRQDNLGPTAAGRRLPDRERAGVGGPCDRDRQRSGCGVRQPRTSRRRQGTARTRRRAQRRADLRRLRAQARCAGEGAAGAAALCEAQARGGVRRGRRPRCRQAPADGRDCERECRSCHRHRRQSAQREAGSDPRRDPRRGKGRDRNRRPRAGDPCRDRGVCSRAMRC